MPIQLTNAANLKTAAQIHVRFPNLAEDLRNDASALVATSGRIGAIIRISTGSPDQHTPQDMEHLLELLREEIGLMESQAESAQEHINYSAFLVDQTPHKRALRKACEDFVNS
jgi:hypothetical protein